MQRPVTVNPGRGVIPIIVSCLVIAGLVLAATGCGGGLKKQLLGKWEVTSGAANMPAGVAVEFKKDGTAQIAMGPVSIEAKYEWTGKDTVEMSMEMMGQKETETMKVGIAGKTLTMTDSKGEATKFKRAK